MDVVEEWRATDPPYNSRRRIEATGVVVENRIVGQPFPVADPKQSGRRERLPYNSRVAGIRLAIQSAIKATRIAKSSVRWAVKLQFLLA
jgi:hypothetical protein